MEELKKDMKAGISEEKLLEILRDHYEESIFITDADGKIVFANKVAEKRLKYGGTDLVGKNVKDLLKDGVYRNSTVLEAIKTGKTAIGPIDENVFSNSVPVFNPKGRLEYVVTNNMNVEHSREWATIIEADRIEKARLKRELDFMRLKEQKCLIANSPVMKDVLKTIDAVAPTDSSVVVLGESGTGKDLIAQLIHEKSERGDGPYLSVNCAAMPESLLESELFGYEAGAFTGARSGGRIGLFEATTGGTIFFDEVGEMSLPLQSKLLRVLESHDIRRVGGLKNISVDVRVICATNKNLEEMVREKTFREDLYYRLSVFTITLPPLKDRKEDIIPIAQMFLEQLNNKYGTNKVLTDVTVETMLNYYWPGNIRELRNVIERIYVISKNNKLYFTPVPTAEYVDKLDDGLELYASGAVPSKNNGTNAAQIGGAIPNNLDDFGSLKEYTDFAEREYILKVMGDLGGSVGKTAEKLGIHRSVLYRKLHKK